TCYEMQVAPGVLRKMDDVVALVHHDGRRPVLFEQPQMQFAEEHFAAGVSGRERFDSGLTGRLAVAGLSQRRESRPQADRAWARKFSRHPDWEHRNFPGWPGSGSANEEPMLRVHWRKERLRLAVIFRAADEEQAAGAQREMEDVE